MRLPKISIVIPSLNKVQFIGSTLQSIVDQDYPNLEVIIRDGGSTDRTIEIVRKFSRKFPNVFLWEVKKDSGQLEAINNGLKGSTGDILTFINADDVYKRGALRKVGEYFIRHPKTVWLAGRGDAIDEGGKISFSVVTNYKNFLLSLNSYSLLLIVNYLMQPSVFLSRQVYLKYGPFTGSRTSVMEYDLWLRLGGIVMPATIDKTLSSFRIYKGSLSTSQFKKILNEDDKIAKKHTKNHLILFLHSFHNLARLITVRKLK